MTTSALVSTSCAAPLRTPARQIAENAGVDGSIVIGKLTEQKNANWGFDAQRGELFAIW